ncbi:MAG TPA: FtsX-like permease family protein [Xanthobacteraceae bacterium]|nr:FtsX-like permease family protein [Xanthobacteraceae bacterium]
MTIAANDFPAMRGVRHVGGLAVRFAWRDLRGGLRGFGVFIACIALGVMTIAGVGSVAASLKDGIGKAGRAILGGDIAFSLIQRQASDSEHTFLNAHGELSVAATMRAMARPLANPEAPDSPGTLVEVKAVDADYPLFGELNTDPALPPSALFAQHGAVFGAAADPVLLSRLGLKIGDHIALGQAEVELRAALVNEPDKLTGGIGLGPRVLMSEAALRATGLVQPGSLVRWQYRLRLPDSDSSDRAVATLERQAQADFPQAGWEIRTRNKASPQLERSVERFSQFLTLVGLATLLVGGVGVANAVASHLARKRDTIATLKALGAAGGHIFAIYCTEIVAVAVFAALAGAALGAALPFVIADTFGAIVPLPVAPALYPHVLALAVVYGLLTALAFALWPLGRAHDISVSMLFRDRIAAERRRPRARYIFAAGAIVASLAALALFTTDDRRIAAFFIAAAAAAFILLRLIAALTMWIARQAPRQRSTILRLAVANIHRAGALTPSVMLSLGLGLALLVTLVEIDGNLHREFAAALPERAPSFFFVDIPAAQTARFDAFVREQAPGATLERVPMLRGRIVAANGVKAEELKPAAGSAWVLRGDRGITYATAVPAGSRIVAGQWWDAAYSGEPLVSLESRTAHDLELKIGDTITVNVLGRDVTARIANLRAVDWESLGINFVLVFSPGIFDAAPHSDIAALTFADAGTPGEETALVKALAVAFPAVTVVRVKEALDAIDALVSKLALALRGASSVTLITAALVLGGALAASQRFRVYDAVVLRTFGATRARLTAAYALEYLLIGLATAIFGVAAGTLAARFVVTKLMEFPFVWVAGAAIEAAAAALVATVAIGLVGTFSALGRKPAAVLRNL